MVIKYPGDSTCTDTGEFRYIEYIDIFMQNLHPILIIYHKVATKTELFLFPEAFPKPL